MDDRLPEDRSRATLRGKGREILLGQHTSHEDTENTLPSEQSPGTDAAGTRQPDLAALELTPDEQRALLDFSGDAPLYDAEFDADVASGSAPPTEAPPDSFAEALPALEEAAAPDDMGAGPPVAERPPEVRGEAAAMDWLDDLDEPEALDWVAAASDDPPGWLPVDADADAELVPPDAPAVEADAPVFLPVSPDMAANAGGVPGYEDVIGELGSDDPAEWQRLRAAATDEYSFDESGVTARSETDGLTAGADVIAEDDAPLADDGLPLGERTIEQVEAPNPVAYYPDPQLDVLSPRRPERWTHTPPVDDPDVPAARELFPRVESRRQEKQAEIDPPHTGGAAAPPSPATPAEAAYLETVKDPFVASAEREPAKDLFRATPLADPDMLSTLVSEDRIQRLWTQIEALHEELVQSVQGDRGTTDVYQQELLQASGLLLESRANYDDASAIVYRIRADLARQVRVEQDIRRYRPLLLNYYIGWGIALVVLFFLRALFASVAESVGVDVVGELYFPALMGIAGALVSGFLTLERHTTRLRDFDPLHISWYLLNPLLGGVMGLLMFLLASIANEDLLHGNATVGEVTITYLLCVIAGMNQNNVLRRLNDLIKRFNPSAG